MNYRLPLRFAVPILILVAGLVIILAAWVLESRDIQRNTLRLGELQLRSSASVLAAEVEAAFRNRTPSRARAAVEQAVSNPLIDSIFVVAPDGTVRFSDDPSAVDRPLSAHPEARELVAALDRISGPRDIHIGSLEEPGVLAGEFPLLMRISPADLMPNRLGSLVLAVDVSGELARQQANLARRMGTWVVVLSLLALGFWALLHRLLLKRIDALVRSVRAIGKGDFEQQPELAGDSDELGALAQEVEAMTGRLREHSERLAYLAEHDALTGLLNRHGFEAELKRALRALRRRGGRFVLILLDIDSLRVINDTKGHLAGDELLQAVGDLLGDALPETIAAARVGGDEFALLLELPDDDSLDEIAARLHQSMASLRFEYEGERFGIQASTGLVELTEEVPSAADALGFADAACYRAKETGRGSHHVGSVDRFSGDRMRGDMKWVSRIQSALDENRLCLHAQRILPVGATHPDRLHFEVLVRMIDEHGKLLPPGEFLAAAERYNLVHRIDRWVVRNTLSWLAHDPRLFEAVSTCSINLSGLTLGDGDLLAEVSDWIEREEHLEPSMLCFEVTETAAIQNLGQARGFVDRLRGLGCRFALDDFGTGLSSFAYFKRLPVDLVKIDGMFIRDLVDDPADRAIVSAINDIAHEVGMQTIAEFVENEATLRLLEEIGVDFAQGYGIGRPIPLEELLADIPAADAGRHARSE